MKNLKKNRLMMMILLLMIFFTACDEDDDEPISSFDISLSSDSNLGDILVDESGMTLYFFSRDADGSSACAGGCLDAWPVFYAENPNLGPGLEETDFGVIDRGDGTMQTTYKGWPLYYFAQDTQAGDVKGEAINNIWWVAKPDYTVMIASQVIDQGGSAETYLVDAEGNTLYMFTPDPAGESVCTGNCINNWPAFMTEGEVVAPSVLAVGDFATIQRPDQGEQHTFQNMPLYYFVNDGQRGDVNGEAVNNVWFILGI